MTRRARAIARVGGGVADQYLFALTNFLVSIAVARNFTATEFAKFSGAYLLYAILLGGFRAAVSEPLAVSARDDERMASVRPMLAWLTGLFLILESTAAAAFLLVNQTGARSSPVGMPLWAWVLALALPFHALQDCGRAIRIAQHRPTTPLISDFLWFACAVAGLILADRGSTLTVTVLVWSAGGVAACLCLLPPTHIRVKRDTELWSAGISRSSLSEYLMQPAVVQISQLMCGFVGSANALSALRGGSVIYRPLQLTILAHRGVVLALGAAREKSLRRVSPILGTGLAVAVLGTALYTVLLWLAPPSIGRVLLGATWGLVHDILLPLSLGQVLSLVSYVLVTDLKAARRFQGLGVIRLPGVVCIPLLTMVGAATTGADGAAWGLCAGQVLALGWMFWFRQRLRPQA